MPKFQIKFLLNFEVLQAELRNLRTENQNLKEEIKSRDNLIDSLKQSNHELNFSRNKLKSYLNEVLWDYLPIHSPEFYLIPPKTDVSSIPVEIGIKIGGGETSKVCNHVLLIYLGLYWATTNIFFN